MQIGCCMIKISSLFLVFTSSSSEDMHIISNLHIL